MTLLTKQGAIDAVTGLQQAGAGTRIKLIAYDAALLEVNVFKNGTIAALFAQSPKQKGEIAMGVASKLIAGQHLYLIVHSDLAVIYNGETAKADCSL